MPELFDTRIAVFKDEEHSGNDEGTRTRCSTGTGEMESTEPTANTRLFCKSTRNNWTNVTKWWSRTVKSMHKPVMAGLQALTHVSARYPKQTIAIVTVTSCLLLFIGCVTNFQINIDQNKLYTPFGSYADRHFRWIQEESGFPKRPRLMTLFFHNNGKNVLGREPIARIFDTLDILMNVSNFRSICPLNNSTSCEISGVPRFWNVSKAIFESSILNDEDAIQSLSSLLYPDGQPVVEDSVFGYPKRDSANHLLTSVLGYTVEVKFPDIPASATWESEAIDAVLVVKDEWNGLSVEIQADSSFADEFNRAIITDIPLVPVVFVVMSIFTCVVFSNFKNSVHSRSLLGFSAVLALLLSIMSGYGIMFILGVPLTSITQMLPFIIFGVGIDDALIIMGSYIRTDCNKTPVDRISDSVFDVGISITLTTATSAAAFAAGCITKFPAILWLCLYATLTIILVLLYQLSFFVSCIVLDERRIQGNRCDCCVCISAKSISQPRISEKSDDHYVDRFMVWYTRKLLHPVVKVLVVIAFILLTVFASFSASKIEQAFDYREVLPADSYYTDFMETKQKYTDAKPYFVEVYFRNVDQSDPLIQAQMENYVNELVAMDSVERQPDFFWLRDLKAFSNRSKGAHDLPFFLQVELFLSDPVYHNLYQDQIVRNDSGVVTASRTYIFMDNVNPKVTTQQLQAFDDQIDVTRAQPINERIFDFAFFSYSVVYNMWEFLSLVTQALLLNTMIGILVVSLLSFIVIPHWTAVVFILPLTSVLYIDLLGAMQWAGLYINAVTYITLVMSIGLIVDYIMHVLLRFYECRGNRTEKTFEMMRTMGSSILLGGLSTFLGTVPLAFSTSKVFHTVFISFMALVMVSIGHSLILLPVLLSYFGAEDKDYPLESVQSAQIEM